MARVSRRTVRKASKAADVKVGVIGYGGAFNMGKAHLAQMKAAGMTPAAVCEIDPTRLEVAKADFPGIETYRTTAEMLKGSDVDLVAIITPHNTHAKLAIQCLKAGRHVVCEKPFAITTAECDAMIAAARAARAVVSTYHNRHWDGCILKAIDMIRGGAIGEVFRVEARMGGYGKPGDWWRTSKSISGGVLYDWGVHLLEYSLQILQGARIAEVSGFARRGHWAPQTAWKQDTNEDEGFAVVRFDTGQWLTLRISSIDSRPADKWVQVTGTQGSYAFDYGAWELVNVRDGQTAITRGASPASEGQKFYDNIAAHLAGQADLVITPQWARRPIHILDLADRSARKGTAMKAKYG